jgi:hypothetical protein
MEENETKLRGANPRPGLRFERPQFKYSCIKGLKLPPQVTGLLGLIELPFPEGCAKDACTALSTGSCPIEAGEIIVYEIDLEVKKG